MPSTYTTNLGIEKVASGEQSGTWGDTQNTNWEIVDRSTNGLITVTLPATGSTGTPNTLAISNGTTSDGQHAFIEFADGGDLGGTAYVQLTPNDAEKICYVRNSLSGGQSVIIFQGTYNSANDYVLANGKDAVIKFDGAGSGAVVSDVFADLALTGLTTADVTVSGTLTATGTVTFNGATVSDLGTVTTADLNGGTIDGMAINSTTIGGTTPAAGDFTTVTATTYSGLPVSDTTTQGIVERATQAEVDAGTDTSRVVTPETLANYSGLGAGSLDGLTDTTITTVGNDEVLQYTGAAWENQTLSEAGIAPVASPTFTGTVTIPTADVNGGNIDGTTIGGTTPANGTFSTLTASTYSGLPTASATTQGIIEVATQAEVDAGTDDTRVVTPATLAAFSGGGDSLSSLTDTTITAVDTGELLQWTVSNKWENKTLSEAGVAPVASPTFTGTTTISTANINGGTIDSTTVGGVTPAAGAFTTLSASTYSGLPAASTTVSGIVELATIAETNTGTSTTLAVTPDALDGWLGSGSINTVGTIGSGVWQGTAISTTYIQNLSGTNTGDEVSATTTTEGIVELATQAEVDAGTDANRVVTASTLANYSGLSSGGTLEALTDTAITTVTNGEVLVWSNTDWINRTFAEAGIAPTASPTFTGTVTSSATINFDSATLTFTNAGVSFAGSTISNLGTVTTADINGGTIDGVSISATSGDFSTLKINGTTISATASELNKMDGVTASATEINYTDITTLGTVQANKAVTAGATAINFNNFDMTNVDINSGVIDGTNIGATTAGTGNFSTLSIGGNAITATVAQLNNTANLSGINTGDEVSATTSTEGIVELATQAEVDAGTDANRVVTASTLANYAGLGSGSITSLTDTNITSITDNELLQWDNGTSKWINQTLSQAGIAGLASPTFTGTVTAPTITNSTTLTASGTVNFSGATVSNLGTVTTADINGGTIDGTNIGGTTAGTGNFSTLSIGGTAVTATAAELNKLDGVTSSATELNYVDVTTLGQVQANKAITAGASSIDFNSFNMLEVDINSGTIDGTTIGSTSASTGNFSTLSIGGVAITSTAAELNKLDGVTATAAELNKLDGVTSTTAELNILDGVTASATELNYNDITTLGTAQSGKVVTTSAGGVINFNNIDMTNVDINSGNIDGTTIGGASKAAGGFTTITTTGAVTFGAEIVETVYALSGTTPALNPGNGVIQTWTLTANSSPTDSLAAGEFITLHILDGTDYTVTWPTMQWVGGNAPTLDSTNANVVELWKIGTTLYGAYVGVVS